MTQKKRQETQQTTEVQLAEDQLASTTVSSAEEATLRASLPLAAHPGYVVQCGMCGTDIWTSFIDDDLVFVCGPCAETLPD